MILSALELCAGCGGQALGLEMAGFGCAAAVEIEPHACDTLRLNRPSWNVMQGDVRELDGRQFRGVDLLAAGVPCPPFSIAGKQLGADDERDMFPATLRIISEAKPTAVLIENVPGLGAAKFSSYRLAVMEKLRSMGYQAESAVLNACDFDVPQLRPRFFIVALRAQYSEFFQWPAPTGKFATVGETLDDLMRSNGWPGADNWARKANSIAPTLVGGSKKHGGPDLGPTRAKQKWRELGVDGLGIADAAPSESFPVDSLPRLNLRMVARIQSFPDEWMFSGRKTAAYRQIGNALPPLVARALGVSLVNALKKERQEPAMVNGEVHQMRLLEGKVKWQTKSRVKKVLKNGSSTS